MATRISFSTANNWSDHWAVQHAVPWQTAAGPSGIEFEATVSGAQWLIRMNDFPDEPLYTLLIDGAEVLHFDDWPGFWGARPPYRKR